MYGLIEDSLPSELGIIIDFWAKELCLANISKEFRTLEMRRKMERMEAETRSYYNTVLR